LVVGLTVVYLLLPDVSTYRVVPREGAAFVTIEVLVGRIPGVIYPLIYCPNGLYVKYPEAGTFTLVTTPSVSAALTVFERV
jgi:hypothetical protein